MLRDNNGWGVAQTLSGFGGLARARGDHAAALGHFRDALALYREIDARPEIARCLASIGSVALSQGDLSLAASSLADSLRLSLATGQRLVLARGLEASAKLAVASGDLARAVKLAGAALALRKVVGQAHPAAAGGPGGLLEAARRQLGPPATDTLLAQGAAMSAHEAVRLATGPRPRRVPRRRRPDRGPGAAPRLRRGRPADRAGTTDRGAHRARHVQPGHRRRAGDQPGHRGPARGQHLRQARVQFPGPGRRVAHEARVPGRRLAGRTHLSGLGT